MNTEPTQAMSAAELADIKRRADISDNVANTVDDDTMADLRRLLEEVDRLRVELETKSVVHRCCEEVVELKKDRAHLKDALSDANAEVSRLRAELAEMETDRDKYQNWYDAAVDDLREVHLSRNEDAALGLDQDGSKGDV